MEESNASIIVDSITKEWLGTIGGLLAVLGVIAAPITSGDTALRSARLIDAGIDDGDLVVVKKQVEANEGDIVVALVDNQNTLKRYFRDDENKKIILHPENKKMKDIIVDECCIQGVAPSARKPILPASSSAKEAYSIRNIRNSVMKCSMSMD